MDCREIEDLLNEPANRDSSCVKSRSVEAHLAHCEDCAAAWQAVQTLRASRAQPIPAPRAGFFNQTMWIATAQARISDSNVGRSRFWFGTGVGGAMAAGIILALLTFDGLMRSVEIDTQEKLFFALHEIRDVNIAIESPAEFDVAEIRVISTGTIGLAGYEGRNELRWSTPLDRGTNMLRLPIAMNGPGGGHLLVEVSYGSRQRTFVVNLRERTDTPRSRPLDESTHIEI